MTGRPHPTRLYHFTHIRNLEGIAGHGLLADAAAHGIGLLDVEIGEVRIKDRRSHRPVPVSPGGTVADYAPFYFAPRSPMMFSIHRGNVPGYSDGCDDLVYLVTTVERMQALGAEMIVTDRNAVLQVAQFSNSVEDLDEMVDWTLMAAKMWTNTDEYPDRKERRQAECLVHRVVPWSAIIGVAARTERVAARAEDVLASLGLDARVIVRPGWYF